MCDIRRLEKLKGISKRFFGNLQELDPLSVLSPSYVSESGLTRSDFKDKIDKVSGCSSIVELKEEFVETKGGLEQVLKVAAANYCKQHAVCPVCSDRTQSRRRARYSEPIREQARKVEAGSRFAYMVTFTVTDKENLSERLEALREYKKNWRLMGQRRKNRKTGEVKRSGGESSKIVAGISSTEIKRGEGSKLWHVHCHDLIFTDAPLDYRVYGKEAFRKLKERHGSNIPREKLDSIACNRVTFRGESVAASKVSEEWFRASGGESMGLSVVRVQHVPKGCSGKKKRMYKSMSFEDSVFHQAKEVLTYFSKLNENSAGDVMEILNDTYNKRMIATYGEFRGAAGDDYEIDTKEDDNCFVLVWDEKGGSYGDPIPGKARDILGEEAKETRKQAGKILGAYRRDRKNLLMMREKYGDSLSFYLDNLKQSFKNKIASLWSLYRQAESADSRMNSKGCDKYSPVLALSGAWIPGSTSKDIYQAAFS